jgi:benzoyl-CoA 2,3-dioxygenase component A
VDAPTREVLRQHLIDPVICIRCNTCEDTCPVHAISHDARNYVVDPSICNACNACISPCPTGSIDNWRLVSTSTPYNLQEQLGWDELPPEKPVAVDALAAVSSANIPPPPSAAQLEAGKTPFLASSFNAILPPWSAAHAYTNLYGPKTGATTATVAGNVRVTEVGREYDTHHVVLDFGAMPFPVLEGQSIGILPPGVDAQGRPHYARQYSVASPRNGERPGYNNISLTIKRVLQDYDGNPVRGVGSNYMCELNVGDIVQVIGPFGSSFLMPNHPRSNIIMICTGTGSAPMRAMTEWRRRLRSSGKFEGGKLMLFFGARTQQDLPYFGPLQKLPKDFIDINFAFSRTPGERKKYVQDVMRERSRDLFELVQDSNTCIYVCGLKAMEEGVVLALRDIVEQGGQSWDEVGAELKRAGRLHLETY